MSQGASHWQVGPTNSWAPRVERQPWNGEPQACTLSIPWQHRRNLSASPQHHLVFPNTPGVHFRTLESCLATPCDSWSPRPSSASNNPCPCIHKDPTTPTQAPPLLPFNSRNAACKFSGVKAAPQNPSAHFLLPSQNLLVRGRGFTGQAEPPCRPRSLLQSPGSCCSAAHRGSACIAKGHQIPGVELALVPGCGF